MTDLCSAPPCAPTSFGLVRSQSAEDAILPANLLRFCDPSGAHDQDAVKASKKSPLVIQALDILLRHDVHRRFPITSGQCVPSLALARSRSLQPLTLSLRDRQGPQVLRPGREHDRTEQRR